MPVVSLLLILVSLVARRWGRRALGRVLGVWIVCLLALPVPLPLHGAGDAAW